MNAEIICVGTEILLGNIVNTNATFIAEQCAKLGLPCYYQSVVGDNAERLTLVVKAALKRSDVIILSGGLGPTRDDLTKEVVAKVMGKKLVTDALARTLIQEYFSKRGIELTENNWKQAEVPEGCEVLYNDNGTAPGIIMQANGKIAILLPGPPNELIPMFNKSVAPYLDKLTPGVIVSQTVKICGLGESKVETMIEDMIAEQSNPTIAPYAKTGEVHLRVTAHAEDIKNAQRLLKPVVKELKTRFAQNIYSTDEETTLEKAVVDLLLANKLTITTVESCTGGLLAGRLINVPGVSEVFKAGTVTYSNKAKRKLVDVKKSTLVKKTAVSCEVATEMSLGAAAMSKADVSVAVTGLAGPDGGTQERPVGTVFIACSVKGKTTVQEYHFSGNRSKIRENAVAAALVLMRKCVLEYYSKVTFGGEA